MGERKAPRRQLDRRVTIPFAILMILILYAVVRTFPGSDGDVEVALESTGSSSLRVVETDDDGVSGDFCTDKCYQTLFYPLLEKTYKTRGRMHLITSLFGTSLRFS